MGLEEDNQLMDISIKDKKKIIEGRLIRVAIVARSKVAEIAVSGQPSYYAIFYKNALIYWGPLTQIAEGSFIKQTFNNGLTFESPHPALRLTIGPQPLSSPNKKKLFNELQNHYSFQEIVYIATTLDSFFEKEQLLDIIHKILSHLKRNGQHFKAFQVGQLLESFEPEEDAAQNQLTSFEFLSYHDIYNSDLASIQQKDPFYFEQYCFDHRFESNHRSLLMNALEREDRSAESLLLWIEAAENRQPSKESIQTYTDIALQFLSFEDWMRILSKAKINPFQALPKKTTAFMETAIKEGRDRGAIKLLLPHINDLPEGLESVLQSFWTNLDPQFLAEHLDEFLPALKTLSESENKEAPEPMLYRLATYLLDEHELETVTQKLAPLRALFSASPTLRKIDHMLTLSEDPDQMMQLGQYYVEFEQWDSAIDCFSFEMEIRPEDAAPVWQLSKMYQHKGMAREAEAYQKFFAELKKNG